MCHVSVWREKENLFCEVKSILEDIMVATNLSRTARWVAGFLPEPRAVASKNTVWPALETGYEDAYGPVDPEVHQAAREVWANAEHLAIDRLHDSVIGYALLKRAVVAVSGLAPDKRDQIRDLPGYLFQTYKRLVLAELEKQNRHRKADVAASELVRPLISDADRMDRHILIAELVRRMDPWTRDVFEALTLGYTFEEVADALGSNPHVVRNRFRRAVRQLAAAVRQTASGPPDRLARPRRISSSTFARLRMMRARLLNPSTWIGRRGVARPDENT